MTRAPVRIVVDGNPETGIIHALIYMPFLKDAYLLVVRQVDPQVFGYYNRTQAAVSEYNRLDQDRSEVQLVFAALYARGLAGGSAGRDLVGPVGRQPAGGSDLGT